MLGIIKPYEGEISKISSTMAKTTIMQTSFAKPYYITLPLRMDRSVYHYNTIQGRGWTLISLPILWGQKGIERDIVGMGGDDFNLQNTTYLNFQGLLSIRSKILIV